MTRDEVKELLPVITAFAEGKPIEFLTNTGKWVDYNLAEFNPNLKYRIKQDTEYRPFKNPQECWEEMKNHQPFAWVRHKYGEGYIVITNINHDYIEIEGTYEYSLERLMKFYTFADGEPFGIKQV